VQELTSRATKPAVDVEHNIAFEMLGPRVPHIAVAWRHRLAGAGVDVPPLSVARAVVATIVFGLDQDPAAVRAELLPYITESAGRTLNMTALSILRETMHRTIATSITAERAMPAIEEVSRLIDELAQELLDRFVANLEAVAMLDPLTGAGNRRLLEQQLAKHLSYAVRHDRPLSIATIDLDGLKRINDTRGHAAGDDAICRLAISLRGVLRAEDSFFRVGGDEFVVVLPETGPDAVERMLARIEGSSPDFSYGVASVPDDATDAAALLDRSDERLLEGRRARGYRRDDPFPLPPTTLLSATTMALGFLLVVTSSPNGGKCAKHGKLPSQLGRVASSRALHRLLGSTRVGR
jgi:diguanylate cyclase (GGDEF)-like protein